VRDVTFIPDQEARVSSTTDRRGFLAKSAVAGLGATAAGGLVAGPALATKGPKGPRGGRPLAGDRTLGGNINKVLFMIINVSDLDRAVEFYEKTYPVTRAETLNGPAQAFKGLGIRHGRFRGRIMRDSQPFQGRGILLVQWLDPGPVGKPYTEANNVGYYRHHASASRSGLNAQYEIALANGGRPYAPPSTIYVTPTATVNAFAFRDPDGTTLEWVGPYEPNPAGAPDALTAYNNNCNDLRVSHAWYRDVLGLNFTSRLNPIEPQPYGVGSLGDSLKNPDGTPYTDEIDYDATILSPRADSRNGIDLLEWQMPRPYGTPYARANNLGTVSMAFEVNSVEDCYVKLQRSLKRPSKHLVAPPETWDLGDYGQKRVLNILDPDGVMIQFIEMNKSTAQQPS
jgi:catechol 2,3-dioxygenase-like lactoylglutathione lyase family enzyme